ncbi:MAG: VTT domain-containing protein [Patescibacteria group bacterium]
MPSIDEILFVLEQYKYWVIFPAVIIDGPIITVLSGFLVHMGVLGGLVTYVILVVGDVIGDTKYFLIGKYSRKFSWAKKATTFLGYTEEREKSLQKHFQTHAYKTFFMAKLSQGLGGGVYVVAGMTGFNFRKFIWISFLGTLPKTFIFMVIGYYMGNSYVKISEYMNSIATASILVVFFLVLYFTFKKHIKNFLNKRDSF